ncbi:MAG: hypothetical protein V7K69_20760 [Nostoc sp.]
MPCLSNVYDGLSDVALFIPRFTGLLLSAHHRQQLCSVGCHH